MFFIGDIKIKNKIIIFRKQKNILFEFDISQTKRKVPIKLMILMQEL